MPQYQKYHVSLAFNTADGHEAHRVIWRTSSHYASRWTALCATSHTQPSAIRYSAFWLLNITGVCGSHGIRSSPMHRCLIGNIVQRGGCVIGHIFRSNGVMNYFTQFKVSYAVGEVYSLTRHVFHFLDPADLFGSKIGFTWMMSSFSYSVGTKTS